jgi:hypothetical protein
MILNKRWIAPDFVQSGPPLQPGPAFHLCYSPSQIK